MKRSPASSCRAAAARRARRDQRLVRHRVAGDGHPRRDDRRPRRQGPHPAAGPQCRGPGRPHRRPGGPGLDRDPRRGPPRRHQRRQVRRAGLPQRRRRGGHRHRRRRRHPDRAHHRHLRQQVPRDHRAGLDAGSPGRRPHGSSAPKEASNDDHAHRCASGSPGSSPRSPCSASSSACPPLFLAIGANPIPDQAPSWERVKDALLAPDDGTLILGLFKVIGWAAWAFMTLSLVVEAIARLRRVEAPKLPGLAPPAGRGPRTDRTRCPAVHRSAHRRAGRQRRPGRCVRAGDRWATSRPGPSTRRPPSSGVEVEATAGARDGRSLGQAGGEPVVDR